MPCWMQYCRKRSCWVDGVTVDREGRGRAIVRVGVGVVAARSGLRRLVDFEVVPCVGVLLGTTTVCGTSGGAVVRRTAGVDDARTGVWEGDDAWVASANLTAVESSGLPLNTPIASTAQMLTAANTSSAAAPAYTARRDGAAYRPTGPSTGLPRPSTQKRQPGGAGGQDASGCQDFGGIQLRRGVTGQFGGTTNRFKTTPPPALSGPSHSVQRHRPGAGYLRLRYNPRVGWLFHQPLARESLESGKLDTAVVNDKVFNALPAVKAGRIAYWGGAPVINTPTPSGEFSSAMSIGGPLGIKYAVPKLVPMLKNALTGKGSPAPPQERWSAGVFPEHSCQPVQFSFRSKHRHDRRCASPVAAV